MKENGRHDTANSLIEQTQNKDRNFTFYIHWEKVRTTFLPRKWSKRRDYCINVNFDFEATNEQILKAYFFSLKLDEILNEKLEQQLGSSIRYSYHKLTDDQLSKRRKCLNESIFEAEEYLTLFDFDKFVQELKDKNWRLDTVYIDKGTNRYKIE